MTIDVNVTVLTALVGAVTVLVAGFTSRKGRPVPAAMIAATGVVLTSAAVQLVVSLIAGDLTAGTVLLAAAVRGAAVGWLLVAAAVDVLIPLRTAWDRNRAPQSPPTDPGDAPTDPF